MLGEFVFLLHAEKVNQFQNSPLLCEMTMGKGIGLVAGLAGQPPLPWGHLLTLKYLNNKQLLIAPEVNTEIH